MQGLVHILSEENGRPTARLIERYKQLLGSVRAEAETKQVLGALGGAAHPGALQLALEQLSTAGVRAEAAAAVKRIAEALKASHPAESAAALEALGSKN